ncbi:putative transcription factor C2H2 family [Helianthus annuus]|nr:putative transcription factor C2H2 family [Helianthus annuus]
MAPIRRRQGTTNNEDNHATRPGNHNHADPQPVQSVDDNVLPHIEELYMLVDIHVKEMHECIHRLEICFQHPDVDRHRRMHQVASGEGSSQSSHTRVQPQLTTCLNCNTLPATMVCYPCRHLSVCLECDTKVSECPFCKNIKLSSYMSNQYST